MTDDEQFRRDIPPDMVLRASGKDGPQLVAARGDGWSQAREQRFLDALAATCNIRRSAAIAGISDSSVHKRRRRDAAFGAQVMEALAQGYVRIEALLIETAERTLAGVAPDANSPIPVMTVKEAMHLLTLHRATVKGGAPQRYDWRGPRDTAEIGDGILAKLARIERAQAREAAKTPDAPTPDAGR